MKGLGQVEIRCRNHERCDPQCQSCGFLRRAERELVSLRCRRDSLFREVKQRLAKQELIMIDLK